MPSVVVALLALLLCANSALAFEGRVVGADGRPVVGAEVTILGRTGTAITDREG